MEVERVLAEAFACEIQIATPRNYPVELERREFDVVVIDSTLIDGKGEAARRLRAAGAGLVFTTLGEEDMAGMDGWAGVPVVAKPFNDHHLVEAVRNAARI